MSQEKGSSLWWKKIKMEKVTKEPLSGAPHNTSRGIFHWFYKAVGLKTVKRNCYYSICDTNSISHWQRNVTGFKKYLGKLLGIESTGRETYN